MDQAQSLLIGRNVSPSLTCQTTLRIVRNVLIRNLKRLAKLQVSLYDISSDIEPPFTQTAVNLSRALITGRSFANRGRRGKTGAFFIHFPGMDRF